jgi:hypothetical protein
MKLLNCTACNDVRAVCGETVTCFCGKSHARCLPDRRTIEYAGDSARILGMRNDEYLGAKPGSDYRWFVISETSPTLKRLH